jgi:hypothetical protein
MQSDAIAKRLADFQPSGEQVRASLGEFHVSPGLVFPQPAAGYRQLQARAVFRWRDFVAEQERAVDLLVCRSGHPGQIRRLERAP